MNKQEIENLIEKYDNLVNEIQAKIEEMQKLKAEIQSQLAEAEPIDSIEDITGTTATVSIDGGMIEVRFDFLNSTIRFHDNLNSLELITKFHRMLGRVIATAKAKQ